MAFNPIIVKLGTNECDDAYQNILFQNDTEVKDNTLLAVMRMFLNEERLKAMNEIGGRIQLQVITSYFSSEESELTKETFVHEDSPFKTFRYGVLVNILDTDNATEIMKKSEEYNDDYKKLGWKKLDDVSQYIDKAGDVTVYQNEKKKGTIIFVGRQKIMQAMHMAASCFPRLIPWCFKKVPITEEEKAIIQFLYNQEDAKFCDAMQKIYDAGDFYGKKLAASLKGFCSANYDSIISRGEEEIRSYERRITDTFDQIRQYRSKLDDAQIRLEAIRNRACCTDEDEAAIVNYLKANKVLSFLRKSDDNLYVGYTGFLNDCDEGAFRHSVENKRDARNYIYQKSPYSFEETKEFFCAIWKEHRFKIRTYCEWRVNSDDRVRAITQCDMEDHPEMMENRIRQPHIDRHACYGGYEATFESLSQNHDFIGTLTTIICSSSYLNWGDSTVVSELMYDLFNERTISTKKYLEDDAGNLYTVAEVFEILKKEKETAAA